MADYFRGHEIELKDDEWVYADSKQPVKDSWKDRPCGECGLRFTDEGHDGCLGTLPTVKNACCGHGNVDEAYVQFNDDSIIQGLLALKAMKALKKV